MAIRSLILSLIVTAYLGYSLTIGLTDPGTFLKKMPGWLGMVLFFGCCVLYLVATWWAFKGFSEHKITAIVSLGFCAFGLGIYSLVFVMEAGSGKPAKGQYEYDFTTLDPTEKAIIGQITQDAGVRLEDAVFTEHWHIADSSAQVRICVQKGHITALNLSNYPVHDLTLLSRLPGLGDLYLKNCGLTDMSGLQSTKLDRLDVSDNQISDLKTLRGCPCIRWLFVANNPIQSTDDLAQFRQLVYNDLTGNLPPH